MFSHSGEALALSEADLGCILLVINVSWASGTHETYGAGLLVFHTFCDTHNIPDAQWCPTTPLLIDMFIASCAGSYTGSTLVTYIFGIWVWHILHGQPWYMDNNQVKAMLNSATNLAPSASKHPKWRACLTCCGLANSPSLPLTALTLLFISNTPILGQLWIATATMSWFFTYPAWSVPKKARTCIVQPNPEPLIPSLSWKTTWLLNFPV